MAVQSSGIPRPQKAGIPPRSEVPTNQLDGAGLAKVFTQLDSDVRQALNEQFLSNIK